MMKKAIILILLLLLLCFSCDRSEVIGLAPIRGLVDTTEYVPRMRKDTTQVEDTTREPISFGVTVDGWGDEDTTNVQL